MPPSRAKVDHCAALVGAITGRSGPAVGVTYEELEGFIMGGRIPFYNLRTVSAALWHLGAA